MKTTAYHAFVALLIACLLLPFAVLAAESGVNEAEFSAYKEITQTKLDGLKESVTTRLDGQDKKLDGFSTRISDLSTFVTFDLTIAGLVLTGLGILAGLFGYFTVRNRAQEEARAAAEEWVKTKGQAAIEEKLAELNAQLEEIRAHIASQKNVIAQEVDEFKKLRAEAQEEIANTQKQMTPNPKGAGVVVDSPPSGVSKLAEALRHKPEMEYSFDDWNTRAFDAVEGRLLEDAIYYWRASINVKGVTKEQSAQSLYNIGIALGQLNRGEEAILAFDEVVKRFGAASEIALREQVAQALVNKGVTLGYLNRYEDEIAVYDEVVKRFGDANETACREQVAKALLNKGIALEQSGYGEKAILVLDEVVKRFEKTSEIALRALVANALLNKGIALGKSNRSEAAMAVYNEVVQRFDEASEPALREQVANAQNGKGFTLLCRAKANWQDEVARSGDLQTVLALFKQAEMDFPSADKPFVWGNQAYSHFLLGQIEPVRDLLKQTLQQGGEKLYQATLTDLAIHPIPPDADFRMLLDEVWAEVQANRAVGVTDPQGLGI